MLSRLIEQKLTVRWKDLLFLDWGKEWFCVLDDFSPAFGTSSDEESETLPGNRVYFT